jgi:hypothetical protein
MTRKTKIHASIIGLILVTTLSACGAPAAQAPAARSFEKPQSEAPKAKAPAAGAESIAQGGNPAQTVPGAPRLIIRNASLQLVVTDVPAQIDAIAQVAKDFDGYIVSSSVNKYDAFVRGTVNLRVAGDRLDAALARLRSMAIEVRSENVTGEDVTAEYVDLESNLKNLEAAEAQLKKIMDGTSKTEDVLSVFNQLTQIRGQIDTIKGRMKFLSTNAALASVSVELIPDAATQPVEAPVWRPLGTVNDATEALLRSLRGLADFVIYFGIAVLPVLVLIALPFIVIIALLRRVIRRGRKRPAVVAPTPAPPSATN